LFAHQCRDLYRVSESISHAAAQQAGRGAACGTAETQITLKELRPPFSCPLFLGSTMVSEGEVPVSRR
jgi:hypothetical protein